jgi:hypothetical protein
MLLHLRFVPIRDIFASDNSWPQLIICHARAGRKH